MVCRHTVIGNILSLTSARIPVTLDTLWNRQWYLGEKSAAYSRFDEPGGIKELGSTPAATLRSDTARVLVIPRLVLRVSLSLKRTWEGADGEKKMNSIPGGKQGGTVGAVTFPV